MTISLAWSRLIPAAAWETSAPNLDSRPLQWQELVPLAVIAACGTVSPDANPETIKAAISYSKVFVPGPAAGLHSDAVSILLLRDTAWKARLCAQIDSGVASLCRNGRQRQVRMDTAMMPLKLLMSLTG